MEYFIPLLISGIIVGSIYAMMGIGLVSIFKATKLLNFCHGEMLMLGAYICWTFSTGLKLNMFLSILITSVLAIFFGYLVERLLMRPVIAQPILAAIMVTLGLSFVLNGLTTGLWAGHSFAQFPAWLPTTTIELGLARISIQFLYAFLFVMVLIGVLMYFFNFTDWGLAMRATAEDHQVAQSLGIEVHWTFALAWIIASITAFVGGIILGNISGLNLGIRMMGLKVFPVVIIGGLDSIPGAVVGGIIIGVAEYLATGYLNPIFGAGFGDIFPFILLVIILLVKPYGLFGLVRIERS